MSDRSELLGLLDQARYNPGAIQRVVIDQVERTYTGELELLDPMNPFIFLMEASSVLGAAGMQQAETLTRRQYPQVALAQEELYLHMSDVDYIGRFATPAKTSISFLVGKEEVLKKAVAINSGNSRKLTIPRNTRITVGDLIFTLQYPIDIRVMGHGGINVVYNNDRPSPLQALDSNKIDWSTQNYATIDHSDYLLITVPAWQFRVDSYTIALNGVAAVNKLYELQDQFYYCRVYSADAAGNWTEILTTHSDQVFNPLVPTVQLKVTDNVLNVKVPQIYFSSGLLANELRVDIYTTKGPLTRSLSTYAANEFKAKWIDLDKDDKGIYSAPLESLTTLTVFSDAAVTGGTSGLTFEELRSRVMNNALGVNNVPITNAQITARLEDAGYSTVVNVDNITNRVFLATRALPTPSDGTLSSGAGATISTLLTSLSDLVAKGNGVSTVVDNGQRMTLLPETLYLNYNGSLGLVSDARREVLNNLSNELLASEVTDNDYVFSPFHYVLDITEGTFATRPYYFGTPEILNKYFLADNDTTGLGVNAASHEITKVAGGWKLHILLDSTEEFKALTDSDVYVQLMFRPKGEQDNAYLTGTLMGKDPATGERIYEFFLGTNWDVDSAHSLSLNTFSMYEPGNKTVAVDLTHTFNLIYVVANRDVDGQTQSWIDTQYAKYLLPDTVVGVYQERLNIKLGDNLEGLWTQARSIVGSMTYQLYENDVYETYATNIYERDATGGAVFEMVDGKPQFKLLHAKGDPVLDADGNRVILHPAGTAMRDENGDLIAKDARGMVRQMDLFVIDGAYYYASTVLDTTYRASVPATVVSWLEDELAPISAKLLEQTKLYFYPKSTIGVVNAIVGEGKQVQLKADQKLSVTLYVDRSVYVDADLRKTMSNTTISTVAGLLQKKVVTRTEILSMLKTILGNDVIAIDLKGLGGDADYTAITLLDDSGRLCIGKKLTALANGTLAVQDDIDINFLRHTDI